MTKTAGTGIWSTIGDLVSNIAGGAKTGYEGLEKLMWYSVPTFAVLASLGAVRTLKPEAVAKNADKLVLQDALLSSLAKSQRRYEQMAKDNKYAEDYNNVRRHDRFI